jgi:poly(A) polymerase
MGVFKTGWNFGTVGTVLHGDESSGYPKQVQITTYRSGEAYRPGSRHPDVTFGSSLEDDLGRRDLTVNSLALDADGKVIDLYGGLQDLADRKLRLLGDPEVTLREDPLRMLRVARFISQLGFRPTNRVRQACHKMAACIIDISRERWFQEIDKLLVGGNVEESLQFLQDTRLLGFLMPEVACLVDLHKTSKHHHKDVWEHTKQVVAQSPPRQNVRWAALLHDIGKPWTREYAPRGKVHFFRHEDHGALLFEGVAHRFRFPNQLRKTVRFLIKHHLRGNLYDGQWTDSAVRRFIKDIGEHLEDLIAFTKADITSANRERRTRNLRLAQELERRCAEISAKDGQKPALPKGLGNEIMKRFGLRPGRHIGDIRDRVEEAVIQGELPAQGDFEVYLSWLDAHEEVVTSARESTGRPRRHNPKSSPEAPS